MDKDAARKARAHNQIIAEACRGGMSTTSLSRDFRQVNRALPPRRIWPLPQETTRGIDYQIGRRFFNTNSYTAITSFATTERSRCEISVLPVVGPVCFSAVSMPRANSSGA